MWCFLCFLFDEFQRPPMLFSPHIPLMMPPSDCQYNDIDSNLLISCDVNWLEAGKRDKLWISQPIRNSIASPPPSQPLSKNRCSHVESLATTGCLLSRSKCRSPSPPLIRVAKAWRIKCRTPFSQLPWLPVLAGSSLSDLIGFPKMIEYCFFLNQQSQKWKGSEHLHCSESKIRQT